MTEAPTRAVFAAMLREEWRLNSRLFGGRRFAAFPLVVAVLVGGTVQVLVATGTPVATLLAGLHALAFVFGLHTGSIGLVGRDALRNLLGEVTLIVFTARTLPLSQRRLLGVFVCKDVVYYAGLFLAPLAAGLLPLALGIGAMPPGTAGIGVADLLLLWVTLTGMFVLGLGVTITAVGLAGRGLAGRLVLAGSVIGGAGAWVAGVPLVAVTPYGVFQAPTPIRIGAAVSLTALILAAGAVTFDTRGRARTRTPTPRFRQWNARLESPVATKTLLDVHRSSGGFLKVVFSAAVLFGVTVALIDLAAAITGVTPSVGIAFGAVLGFSAFTTYNWLTQADDVESYLTQPLDVAAVFRAKFRAFLVLGPLVGLATYAVAVAWRGSPPAAAAVGAVLLVGVACYIFGVTVYLTGLSPNEFLFDTLLFAAFAVAMVVPVVPMLVVGVALAPVGPALLAGLTGEALLLGAVGVGLYRRAIPKWTRYHRR